MVEIKLLRYGDLTFIFRVHNVNVNIYFVMSVVASPQNYYYQIINIDEIGSNDKTAANSGQLQKMLFPQDVTNDMKKLLITKPMATESQPSPSSTPASTSSADATVVKPDVKPNVSTTSSSSSPAAATLPSKSEQ